MDEIKSRRTSRLSTLRTITSYSPTPTFLLPRKKFIDMRIQALFFAAVLASVGTALPSPFRDIHTPHSPDDGQVTYRIIGDMKVPTEGHEKPSIFSMPGPVIADEYPPIKTKMQKHPPFSAMPGIVIADKYPPIKTEDSPARPAGYEKVPLDDLSPVRNAADDNESEFPHATRPGNED